MSGRQDGVSAPSAVRGKLDPSRRRSVPLPVPELSAIEEQMVLLVAEGRSHREIAGELGLSLKTVEWHLARAGRKLGHAAALHDRIREAGELSPDQPQRRSER